MLDTESFDLFLALQDDRVLHKQYALFRDGMRWIAVCGAPDGPKTGRWAKVTCEACRSRQRKQASPLVYYKEVEQ
jgi:hypothetical protein